MKSVIRSLLAAGLFLSISVAKAVEPEIVEKPLSQLPDLSLTKYSELALSTRPEKWKHGETKNFIIHFRRVTEAKKVAREIEYYAEFLISFLAFQPGAGAGKSHVFIFEDDDEWRAFVNSAEVPEWTGSFALGDELFLNVRESREGRFDSQTLAHETAHAVVSRLFPKARLPLWLNEGFAEYVAGVAVAARKGQYTKGNQRRLEMADMPLEELIALTVYPSEPLMVGRLYQTGEKIVRFLVNEHGKERFAKMVKAIAAGEEFAAAFQASYGDLYADLPTLEKKVQAYRR